VSNCAYHNIFWNFRSLNKELIVIMVSGCPERLLAIDDR
jgi:hypothetical protein